MASEAGGGGSGGGDETPLLSPRSKLKFLCSYGGKILPRPTDGHLKYVGGETRVIAMPRDIKFPADLMKKLTALFDGDMVLKYQLVPEDLDVLVSVRSDEDLKHMLDEYDRLESEGTPKLRCFLFPSNPIVIEAQPFSSDPQQIEQRYLEAINGIVRSGSSASAKLSPTTPNRPTFSISSACSSPKSSSPDAQTAESMAQETFSWNSMKLSRPPMHKVHSSPSLCSFNNLQPPTNIIPVSKHHIQQRHYHYQQNQLQQQQQHHNGYQSSRIPPEFSRSNAPERVPMNLSPSPPIGRSDFGRSPMGPNVSHHTSSRQQRGIGLWNKYGYSDEFAANGCGRIDRTENNQWSPRKPLWE
ncbi:PB1 domain-containing protein [Cucumis melo var. makuwa]|uniref:PB1 domain-containing protein n=1 Tax=Cucumis melo var. makuwa TaxID=1194695 RepID=A0A5A7UXB3_CUCMM|nr:PB1 domain-containing protein [Cucumis melo var. makuwa]TYK02278.1 PB1 domain-containing protein [Cucumis melo var. makuwa]